MNTLHDSVTVKTMWQAIRGDVYNLAGDYNSTARQKLMLAITGEKRPKAKCGVNAIWAEMALRFNPAGDCIANREDAMNLIVANL